MFDAVFRHCRSVFTQSDAGRSESMLEEPIEDSQELPSWGGKRKKFLAHLSRRLRGELIVYRSSRRPCVRLSVRLCVHTFKHEYL